MELGMPPTLAVDQLKGVDLLPNVLYWPQGRVLVAVDVLAAGLYDGDGQKGTLGVLPGPN